MKKKDIIKKQMKNISTNNVSAYTINSSLWLNDLANIRKEIKKNKQFKKRKKGAKNNGM